MLMLLLLLLLLQINWRREDDPITANTAPEHQEPAFRAACRTKIYLGYTSNLISAGVREQIRCAHSFGVSGGQCALGFLAANGPAAAAAADAADTLWTQSLVCFVGRAAVLLGGTFRCGPCHVTCPSTCDAAFSAACKLRTAWFKNLSVLLLMLYLHSGGWWSTRWLMWW